MISKRNTSYSYVIREGKFNILFGNDDNVWHIIQRFGNIYIVEQSNEMKIARKSIQSIW